MHNRLMKLFDDQKILYSKQFGFRKKCSASHTIISLIENIQKRVDDKQFAGGIFIALKKAFDSVDHIANMWFKSYLSNHIQYVSINDFSTNHNLIKYGVPQASVLEQL